MPLPGPDFLRMAERLGGELPVYNGKGKERRLAQSTPELNELYRRAIYDEEFVLQVKVKRGTVPAACIPGHLWGGDRGTGPGLARVMVLGKWPGNQEAHEGRMFSGESGAYLAECLENLGIVSSEYLGWYVTCVVHHPNVDPSSDRMPKDWLKNWAPVLQQELALTRPDIVLCLGREAADAILDEKIPIKDAIGQVYHRSVRVRDSQSGQTIDHPFQAVVITNPAAVLRDPDQQETMLAGLRAFCELYQGKRTEDNQDQKDWHVVYYEDDLSDLVDTVIERGGTDPIIVVDCEWQGEYPNVPGSYLRTIQFSDRGGFACCVVLRHAGGQPAFLPSVDRAVPHLRRLLMSDSKRKVRVAGHHVRADIPHIHAELDAVLGDALIAQLAPAETPEECRYHGGFDTMVAAHAYRETGFYEGFKLEYVCQSLLGVKRWNIELEKWKDQQKKKKDKEDLAGYGDVPDEILHPYALGDVDYPRRLIDKFIAPGGLLDCDETGNACWVPYWRAQRASQAFLEMEMVGVHTDKDAAVALSELFQTAAVELEAQLREAMGWSGFNINSPFDLREFLFGEAYAGRKQPGRKRPEEAESLYLAPIKSTGKPSQAWEKIRARNQEHLYNASTDKEVLGILLGEDPRVAMIRNLKFLNQMLKMTLRPALREIDTNDYQLDEDGELMFDSGLIASVLPDSRMYTHFFPTTETGRSRSARPNLTNLCLDSESEYLTSRGWVRVMDLLPSDEVAQFWPDNGKSGSIDFVVPSEIHVSSYKGEMVHLFREKTIDLLVTPDHRCLLRSRARRGRRYYEQLAKDFGGDSEYVHAGFYRGGEESLTAAQVTWLTAVQADGSINDVGGIVFHFSKERKTDRLVAAMQQLGIEYSRSKKNVLYVGVQKNRAILAWTVSLLGEEKQFGPWLLRFDRETLQLFADELCHWDGKFKTKGCSFSSDRQSADWYQIIWALTGNRARMSPYVPANPNARTCWIVNRPARGQIDFSYSQHVQPEMVPYEGHVYCVTVPSGWIVVRRNGVVSVTGNSKRREKDYERILGPRYDRPIRSLITATPAQTPEEAEDPWLLVDFDLRGAELYIAAVQSGDLLMIEHCQRSNLDEKDPNYYDIHSSVAVRAFSLKVPDRHVTYKDRGPVCDLLGLAPGSPLPATKSALVYIGKESLRIAAKSLIFGLMYGRGDEAVVRAVMEEQVHITVQDAAKMRQLIFSTYPGLERLFESCRQRVTEVGYMDSCLGRRRRFPFTKDDEIVAKLQREAMNYPIQSAVADAVNDWMYYLYHYPGRRDEQGELRYRFLLQIHDALLCECRASSLEWFCNEVIPSTLDRIDIWPADLDGRKRPGARPYKLGTEIEIQSRWGVKLTREEGLRLRVPECFLPAEKQRAA